jgi:hypothetical protein
LPRTVTKASAASATIALVLAVAALLLAAPTPPPPPPAEGTGRIHVTLAGDGAELKLWRAQSPFTLVEPTRPLCESPCDLDLAKAESDRFFIDGPATPSSLAFALPQESSKVRITVTPGDLAFDRLGWAIGLCGAAAMTVGVGGLITNSGSALVTTYGLTVAVGVVLEVFGFWLQFRARTQVNVEELDVRVATEQQPL